MHRSRDPRWRRVRGPPASWTVARPEIAFDQATRRSRRSTSRPALADGAARPRVDDPERGMAASPCSACCMREQGSVRRETGAITHVIPVAGDPDPLSARAISFAWPPSIDTKTAEAAVAIRDRDGGDPGRAPRRSFHPTGRPSKTAPEPPPSKACVNQRPAIAGSCQNSTSAPSRASAYHGSRRRDDRRRVRRSPVATSQLWTCHTPDSFDAKTVGRARSWTSAEGSSLARERTLPQRHLGHRDRLPGTVRPGAERMRARSGAAIGADGPLRHEFV